MSVFILRKWKSLCFTGFFWLNTTLAVLATAVPDSIKTQLDNTVQHADLTGMVRLICSEQVKDIPSDTVSSYLRAAWDEYAQKKIFPTIYAYNLTQYKQFLDSARNTLSDSCLKRLVKNSGLTYELNYYYGYYYSNLGDYATAEGYFTRSFEPTNSPQSTPPQDAYNISLTYQQIAFGYLSSGDYQQALEFFQTSLSWLPGNESFYEQINSPQFYRSIRLSQMGECYQKLQQYDSAQRFLNRSLRIQRANLEKNGFQSERYRQSAVNAVRQTLERLVNLYREQEEYAIALDYLNQSQQLNAGGQPDFETLKISADIAMARGNPVEALARYRASLARIEETFGRNSLSGGQVLLGIARSQLEQKKWEEARKTIQQGFAALTTSSGKGQVPEYDSLLVPLTGWEMLLVDIEARIDQTLHNNGDLSLLLEELTVAMNWADNLRKSYTNASAKQLLVKQSVQLYEASLFVVWQLFQETGQKKYLNLAFQFMERSKGNILRDAVLNSRAKKFAGIPESLQEEEKQLKGQIAYLKTALTEARSSEESAAITRQLLLAKQGYESFISELEQDFPRYFQFKYSSAVPEVKTVQEQMNGNEMILSFFAGDHYWYRIALQADDIAFTRVPHTPELQQQVTYLINALSDEETVNRQGKRLTAFQKFSANALAIYQTLFGQPLDNFSGNRLVIIPDGRLGYLPLHILINEEPEQNTRVDYAGLPYLFKKYAVRRQYSVSLMLEQQTNLNTGVRLNYAGFAPDFKGTDKLLFNHREVEALYSNFGGTRFTGDNATENEFKKHAVNSYIVHLATHTRLSENAQQSGFRLNTSSAEEDGFLHTYELYNMQMDSEMAILSACETGRGKLIRGEGIISLARAFNYAGCNNVAMTLWKVNNLTTARLVELFSQQLAQGKPKDEALKEARLAFLSDEKVFTHPYFWSGLVLIGDREPLQIEQGMPAYKWVILGIVILGVMLVTYRFQQKRQAKFQ